MLEWILHEFLEDLIAFSLVISFWEACRSEMTLNYWVIVERHPFFEWIGWWVNFPLWNLLSTWREKLIRQAENQEPTHCKVGSKPHHASRGFLSRVGPTSSNSRRIAWHWLLIWKACTFQSWVLPFLVKFLEVGVFLGPFTMNRSTSDVVVFERWMNR